MPLDASLLLGAQGVQLPDPVAQYGKMLTLGDLARQSRVGDLKEEELRRGLDSQRAYESELPDLVRSNFSTDAIVNSVTRNPNAAQAILKESDARKKAALDQAKTGAETSHLDAETRKMDMAMVGGLAQSIMSNPNAGGRDLQALVGLMQRVKIDPRTFGDPSQDPAGWLRNAAGSSIEAAKQLELQGQADTRAETAGHNRTTERLTAEQQAELGRHNVRTEGLTASGQAQAMTIAQMQDSRARDLNEATRDANKDNRINSQTQALAHFVDANALPNLLTSANALDKVVQDSGTSGMPGVGRIAGQLPSWMISEEGKKTRATIQAVANDLLKLYSGGAVTANEAERRATEMMASGSYTADDLRNAWPLVRGRINAATQNARAGFSPEAVNTYESRGGVKLRPIGGGGGATGDFDSGGALQTNGDGSYNYVPPGKR